ncbi:MAG: hypothetical protein EKK57_03700 [Proteobacteria bacterium]|nr:MAG: hypothetical protein EKK57_03700 [Pseudomonadota bacterium]
MNKLLFAILSAVVIANANSAEVKVAAVTFVSQGTQQESNIAMIVRDATVAAKNGAKLIVFPEEASNAMFGFDTIPGKLTTALTLVSQQYHVYIAAGLQEQDINTGLKYNAAVLVGPDGFIGRYRKNQLNIDDSQDKTPGNLGFPVFDTEIGKISLLICYDDSQIQSLLLPALRGADIIVYPLAAAKFLRDELGSNINHSTLGSMATLPGWIGVNVVAADYTGMLALPQYHVTAQFPGASSIWSSTGKTLNSAPTSTWSNEGNYGNYITYATLETGKPSPQRAFWLKHRRPELYTDLNLYRAQNVNYAAQKQTQISSLLVQYNPKTGNVQENYNKIDELISKQPQLFNLAVLPYNSFIGNVDITKKNIGKYAEKLNGQSYQLAAGLAKKYHSFLIFSMPEEHQGKYYETAILFDNNGQQIGIYRKSHLNDIEQIWATTGNDLPVFNTELGKIAIILNDETRIPELSEVYALKRADIITIPVAYNQKTYGGNVDIQKGIVPDASNRGMYMWYDIAKYSQAYTLVANYINGEHHDIGQSAVYSQIPEEGFYPPSIAPSEENAYLVRFITNNLNGFWTTQQNKVSERRYDLAAPLTLDMQSNCFKNWQINSTSVDVCGSK